MIYNKSIKLLFIFSLLLVYGCLYSGEYAVLKKPFQTRYYKFLGNTREYIVLKYNNIFGTSYFDNRGNEIIVNDDSVEIYGEYSNRLVYFDYITNIKDQNWGHIKYSFGPLTNVWIKIDDSIYRFNRDSVSGKLYLSILTENNLLMKLSNSRVSVYGLNLKLESISNKYIFIYYTVPGRDIWSPISLLYLNINNKYYKAIEKSGYENIYILSNYVILYHNYGSLLAVYKTDINHSNINNGLPLYQFHYVDELFENVTNYINKDSYLKFEKNNIVYGYIRIRKGKPYIIRKWRFVDGVFIPLGINSEE